MKSKSVVLDTNVLILYILGLIDPLLVNSHRRTSTFDAKDYYFLLDLTKPYENFLSAPNIFTELDNLLNNHYCLDYNLLSQIRNFIALSKEEFIFSHIAVKEYYYPILGLTDSVILKLAEKADLLISADSKLCDYAKAFGIKVFDFKEYKNNLFKRR